MRIVCNNENEKILKMAFAKNMIKAGFTHCRIKGGEIIYYKQRREIKDEGIKITDLHFVTNQTQAA